MSTRATYRITEDKGEEFPTDTFYIHYDGYPEGAAEYFHQLLTYREEQKVLLGTEFRRKSMAAMFEMGIPLSEKTKDHDAHGDTEYRYNLFFGKIGNQVQAYKRKSIDLGEQYFDHWEEFFKDDIDKFIKQFRDDRGDL